MALASELVQAKFSPEQAKNLGGQTSTIAAAGNSQGTATAVTASLTTVTGADGTKGVILPAALPGDTVRIYSSAATNALIVYPPSGAAINAASANASYSHTAQTEHIYCCFSATQWTVN